MYVLTPLLDLTIGNYVGFEVSQWLQASNEIDTRQYAAVSGITVDFQIGQGLWTPCLAKPS